MGRVAVPTTQAALGRQTESRLRELDRKSAGAASGVEQLLSAARHHWHGTGEISAGGIAQLLDPWVSDIDEGVANLTAGRLVLNQPGRWALWFQLSSDASEPGNSGCFLQAESGPLAPWGPWTTQLRDERLRGSGYANAGNLTQSVTWSGVVTEGQAASPISPAAYWRSGGTGLNASAEWILSAHYLGAARLPND